MSRIWEFVDVLFLILCLPFYAVAVPLIYAYEWLSQKRGVRLGLTVTHWPMRDVREDYTVADVSRLDEGLVGIRRRRWNLLRRREPPPFRDAIEYVRRERFWVPMPFSLRKRRSGRSQVAVERDEPGDSEQPAQHEGCQIGSERHGSAIELGQEGA